MIVGISLMLWAGWHNLRARRVAMQKAQSTHMVMTPGQAGQPGQMSHDDDESGAIPGIKLRGKAAPGFTLKDLDGKKVSLADYKGRAVLVNFWATWCAPCKIEMPWFEELRKQYAAQGFEVLGLTDDADAGKDVICEGGAEDGRNLSDSADGWEGADVLRRPGLSADVVLRGQEAAPWLR